MAAALTVGTLAESDYPRWEKFVAAAPGGSVYSLPGYLDALCTAAGGRFRLLAARQGEEIAGGVALYERDSRLGRYVSPRLPCISTGFSSGGTNTRFPPGRPGAVSRSLPASQRGMADPTDGG